jgi:LDH2 family malate/lactate/ureidoglycolate dehydrogenase
MTRVPDAPAALDVPAGVLAEVAAEVLRAVGVPEGAARTVAGALVDADLDGVASHGVLLLPMYVERLRAGSVTLAEEATVVSDRGSVVVLDAAHALGHVTGDQAMALAVERAHRYGTGLAAVRHAFHFGTARRYAVAAARQGCVGLAMCNTRPLMPAPGGAERLVGNNPLAFALPAADEPIVLDMALSAAAMGKIRMAEEAGWPIPDGWATDGNGVPTTDAAEAVRGMLLPSAGHKGFGLAFVVDLLCGLLSGGAWGDRVQPLYGDPAVPYDCSHLFLALDIGHARPPGEFAEEATAAAERVRRSRPAPGTERLYAPGDPERERRAAGHGMARLDPSVVRSLRRCAESVGVDVGDRLPAQER